MASLKLVAVLVCFSHILNQGSTQVTGNRETVYTAQEKEALLKFRELVKDTLYLDYQTKDAYLINWLRAKKLDLQQAKTALEKSLRWRRENRVDSILEEKEMVNIRQAFPFTIGGVDKAGRPVLEYSIGKWHSRKYIISGKVEQMKRYTTYQYETAAAKVREIASKTNKDISQWYHIINMNSFNLRQHTCLACVPVMIDSINQYEAHYPNWSNGSVIVNAPRAFNTFISNYKALFPVELYKDVHIFSHDKQEWRKFLATKIDDDQLGPEYGGTRGVEQ